MDQLEIITELETRAKSAGVSIAAVCELANVHPTTVSRWKQPERFPATFGAINKLRAALDEIERQPARASEMARVA